MAFSGGLEKMNISAYSKSDFTAQVGETFAVYINPDKYSHNYKICYNNTQAQGSPGGSPSFNKMGEETMAFELVFDGTGVIPTAIPGVLPFTEDGITAQIDEFKKLVFSYDGNIHSPKYLKLVWGTMLFKCRMTKLSLSFTLFKPDGTPLRAKADVNFVGYTDELELEKKASKSSPDLSHLVAVKAGDTLPDMCYKIYGDSKYYIEVARVNNLTDFRSLSIGCQLLFPPLGEQVV